MMEEWMVITLFFLLPFYHSLYFILLFSNNPFSTSRVFLRDANVGNISVAERVIGSIIVRVFDCIYYPSGIIMKQSFAKNVAPVILNGAKRSEESYYTYSFTAPVHLPETSIPD